LSALNIALLTVGGLVLVIGLLSDPLKRSLLSLPMIGLLAGILLGPGVSGLLDVAKWGDQHVILEEAARLTLGIALMGVALRLPKGDPFRRWKSLLVLLGLVMPFMWLSSGLLTFLILGLPFWVALLVGAVVTPTDPVVASTIVTGSMAEEKLPDRIRHTLSAESGANDGLAYPFVFLPILMLAHPPEEALVDWLTRVILWEVGGAVIVGALIGYAAGRLLEWAEAKEMVEQTSFIAYTLALSLAVLGGAKLIGTDGILAVFVAGVAFDMAVQGGERAQEQRVQEAVNRFFILPIFVLLGLVLPWGQWLELGWAGLALTVAVLLFRRLPALLVLNPLLGRVRGFQDALFLGWFGPIGVAALFYANLSLRETGAEAAWVVGSLIITASIVVHGVSAAPFTRLYGRHAESDSSGQD
jgi:NhaP-type Na+/H+ or K+/H+ antiporter